MANARRIRSDLEGAERAFRAAWGRFEAGSRDLFEKAILLDLEASLHRARRRFAAAFGLLRRAVGLFLELGERHRAGRSLVNLATVYQYAGEPERGIPVLHQALSLIDPAQEPRLMLLIHHNLVDCLAVAGRFLEAQGASREAREWFRRFPDDRLRLRRQWVEGKIARGLGQLPQAEALFLAARDGFLAEGIPYETALVSLELALLYAEQGRTAELKGAGGRDAADLRVAADPPRGAGGARRLPARGRGRAGGGRDGDGDRGVPAAGPARPRAAVPGSGRSASRGT